MSSLGDVTVIHQILIEPFQGECEDMLNKSIKQSYCFFRRQLCS